MLEREKIFGMRKRVIELARIHAMLEEMNDTGKKLVNSDLEALEGRLQSKLPRDFFEFLLRYNGGEPAQSYIDFNGSRISIKGAKVSFFYRVGLDLRE